MQKSNWKKISHLSAREIRELQNAKLRSFVQQQLYPFSPFYRELFDKNKINPQKIQTVADLVHVPFSTKKDLLPSDEKPKRALDFVLQPNAELIQKYWPLSKKLPVLWTKLTQGHEAVVKRMRSEYYPIFVTFTTGRSSLPVSFLYTQHDMNLLHESGYRLLDVAELAWDTKAVNMFPFAPHLAFWQVTFAGVSSGIFILGTGGGKSLGTAGNIRAIEKLQANTIMGVPGFVYHCLREAHEAGAKLGSVRTVILGAEKIPSGMRERITETLKSMGSPDVKIFGTYGFTEARMAWMECPSKDGSSTGYHLFPDLALFEVIDPVTGEVKKEGEDGELVFTPLAGRGSCVFRYRTGDLVKGGILWEPCPSCGRTVPRICSSLSRASNNAGLNLTKIKGTLVSLDELAGIVGEFKDVEEWQVELRKKHDDPLELDEIVLYLSLSEGCDVNALKTSLRNRMLSVIEIVPNAIEVLPLKEMIQKLGMESEMKEKRFVDRRPK